MTSEPGERAGRYHLAGPLIAGWDWHRKRLTLALLFLALCATLLGLIARHLRSERGWRSGAAAELRRRRLYLGSSGSTEDAAARSRLFGRVGRSTRGMLEELMREFSRDGPPEAMAAAAQAFVEPPEIAEALEGAIRPARGGRPTAARFVERLAELPDFESFAERAESDAAFSAAVLRTLEHPTVLRVLLERRRPKGKRSHALARASRSGQRPRGHAALAAGPGRAARAPGDFLAAASSGTWRAEQTEAPGPGAHGVVKLGPVGPVGRDTTEDLFASVFATLPKPARARLKRLCDEQGVCDPAQACRAADLEAECRKACAESSRCSGLGLPGATAAPASSRLSPSSSAVGDDADTVQDEHDDNG
ncbi:MAG: hypothetical protein HY553_22365, partial [Elusimicrobia bacterium]|nr:hypothetical protein [Elusimicrobiota bacterium]